MPELILNPKTNRFVKVGGPKYNRLVKEGFIKPEATSEVLSETIVKPTPELTPKPTPEPTPEPKPISVKAEMAVLAVDLVKKNEAQFVDLTKKETDKLLRKLLLERLCPKPKAKKGKKSKYKLKEPSSESESDSESD
jgi:hypothetical protein